MREEGPAELEKKTPGKRRETSGDRKGKDDPKMNYLRKKEDKETLE